MESELYVVIVGDINAKLWANVKLMAPDFRGGSKDKRIRIS